MTDKKYRWHGRDMEGNDYEGFGNSTQECIADSIEKHSCTCHMEPNPDYVLPPRTPPEPEPAPEPNPAPPWETLAKDMAHLALGHAAMRRTGPVNDAEDLALGHIEHVARKILETAG